MVTVLTVHIAIIIVMRDKVCKDEVRMSAPSHVDV